MKSKDKNMSWFDFINRFPDEESCLKFLSDMKWKQGYHCHRCHHEKYCKGHKEYDRRCTSCGYIESPTANTLFHQLKFSLQKALFIIYLETTFKKGMSSTQMSLVLDLRQGTCWLFKKKIAEAMDSSLRYKMTGIVQVLICEMGVNHIKVNDKIIEKKKLVVLATELGGDRRNWIYGQTILNQGAVELSKIFNNHFDEKAKIFTSSWKGYIPINPRYENMEMTLPKSRKSKNARKRRMPDNDEIMLMYRQSMGFYNTLRGTYGHGEYMQSYLNEYLFRLNRCDMKGRLFEHLVERMLNHAPMTYSAIATKASKAGFVKHSTISQKSPKTHST